jgi:hypothetical protein
MQDWEASRSQSFKEKLLDTFSKGDAKWILMEGNPDNTLVSDVLNERYICVAEREKPFVNTVYHLYREQSKSDGN